MTTTNTYNPLLNALREITTPQAFRWYGTQAKATAALASTIALRSFTTARHLLNASKPVAIAAVAEAEVAIASAEAVDTAIAELENAIAMSSAIAQTEAHATASTLGLAGQDDSDAVEVLDNATATHQEYASTEATEPEESPVSDDWEAIEAVDTAQAEPEQTEAGWEAIEPAQDMAIASAIEAEPELDDIESDCLAIDEPQQVIASTEPQQAIALSEAETIALEPDLSAAGVDDSEVNAELAGVDDALLDEDDTELRWNAETEAEPLSAVEDEDEKHVTSHQWEDDALGEADEGA